MSNNILKHKKDEIHKYLREYINIDGLDSLLDDHEFNRYADFYNYYPFLFYDAFDNVAIEKISKINIASFLCFKSVVINDELVDSKSNIENFEFKKLLCETFNKEARKLLHNIFDHKSAFWTLWEKRISEIQKTKKLDSKYTIENITYKEYEEFADGKSAMAKLAIDSLYILSGKKEEKLYYDLLTLQKHYSVSMQLFDDLFDVTEDYENKQFNIATYYLTRRLKKQDINAANISLNELEKYVFLSDIDGLLMRKAIKHLSASNQIAEKYNLKSWLPLLKTYENIFNGIIKGKEEYLCALQSRIIKKLKFSNISQVENSVNLIEGTIKLGSEYVQLKHKKGRWLDYKTSAGISDTWATGFIAYLGKEFLPKDYYNSAIGFLTRENSSLWGYKENYINDSDSSNFALLIMMGAKKRIMQDKIKYLLARQNKDGGFPTYTDEEVPMLRAEMKYSANKSYAGWTQSHVCVSSVSFHLLASLPPGIESQRLALLQKFLGNKFQTRKTLSYWWTSDIYSIYWCMLSYDMIDDNKLKKNLIKRIDKLVDTYISNNSVGDAYNHNSIFYSSMLLKILCILFEQNVKTYEGQIETLVSKIVLSQFEDGSWASTNALRLPDTNVTDPATISSWPESERGCNVRAMEWNSLFTTVVATNAIFHYKRILKDGVRRMETGII
jgi:hypothetical protein